MTDAAVDARPLHDDAANPPVDASAKTCGGQLADLDDPSTGCGAASCTACPLPPGATTTLCTAEACDYTCLQGLSKTATGCGPASPQIVSTTSPTVNDLSCAITPHGNVKCWGQLGVIDLLWNTPAPQLVSGLANVRALAGGGNHICALTAAGAVWCWGQNDNGQLGTDTTDGTATPVEVELPMAATALTAGFAHTCAALQNGDVWCWGSNSHGVLGRSTTATSNPPAAITFTGANVVQLAASRWHTCGLRQGGTILCWGANLSGELGSQPLVETSLPVQVAGISDATAVAVGGMASSVGANQSGGYTFAIRAGGNVYAWGFRTRLLGLGDQTTAVTTPSRITALSGVVELVSGPDHVCSLASAGTLTCWGNASYGRLGQTGLSSPNNFVGTPTAIPDLGTGIRHVTTGRMHTCMVHDDELRCAGANSAGQLGTGTTSSYSATPLAVTGWSFDD